MKESAREILLWHSGKQVWGRINYGSQRKHKVEGTYRVNHKGKGTNRSSETESRYQKNSAGPDNKVYFHNYHLLYICCQKYPPLFTWVFNFYFITKICAVIVTICSQKPSDIWIFMTRLVSIGAAIWLLSHPNIVQQFALQFWSLHIVIVTTLYLRIVEDHISK